MRVKQRSNEVVGGQPVCDIYHRVGRIYADGALQQSLKPLVIN